MTFEEVVNKLREALKNSDRFNVSRFNRRYLWIEDRYKIIGKELCHYEFKRYRGSSCAIEVHFEDPNRYRDFWDIISSLPKYEDTTEHNKELYSIIVQGQHPEIDNQTIDKRHIIVGSKLPLEGDINVLVNTLKENLLYVDDVIGNKLRKIINPNFKPNQSIARAIEPSNPINQPMNHPLNQILFGPPGTGKTYNTINRAISIINPQFNLNQERDAVKAEYDRLVKEGQIVFCTFHQNMSYEDFIEGIKPITQDGKVVYEVQDGIFKQLCITANTPHQGYFNISYEKLQKKLSEVDRLSLRTPTGKQFEISLNSNGNLTLHTGSEKKQQGTLTKQNIQRQINGEDMFVGWDGYFKGVITMLETEFGYVNKNLKVGSKPNFVLIIDEINRGNVSSIFGELITLIEDDKRIDADEELRVVLPYSKELFGVPSNVHIIGTMNTADRSVEALDTALRRRFTFTEMPPKSELISRSIPLKGVDGQPYEVNLKEMLDTINSRIERLIDKDHKIGHSYFINVQSEDDLKEAFRNKVIPLLEEYFFGDFGKIGLVLGDSFVEKVNGGFEFAAFSGYDSNVAQDLKERCVYTIKDLSQWNFRSIYTPNKAQ